MQKYNLIEKEKSLFGKKILPKFYLTLNNCFPDVYKTIRGT